MRIRRDNIQKVNSKSMVGNKQSENVSCLCGYCCSCLVARVCVRAQSCLTFRDSVDYSPPAISVHGIFQARILEWVAISSSRGCSQPRDGTCISCIGSWNLTTEPPQKAQWQLQRYLQIMKSLFKFLSNEK